MIIYHIPWPAVEQMTATEMLPKLLKASTPKDAVIEALLEGFDPQRLFVPIAEILNEDEESSEPVGIIPNWVGRSAHLEEAIHTESEWHGWSMK